MNPPPPPAEPPPRGTTAALAVAGAVLLALLVFRGYGHQWGARPTEVGVAGVDLNRADAVDLEQVPGLGPKRAAAIVAHRAAYGPFADTDALTHVPGVGPHTAEKAGAYLTIPPTAVPVPETLERKPPAPVPAKSGKLALGDKLDVNAATEADLQRLPGVGPTLARRIVETRAGKPFAAVDDLRRVRGIGAKTLDSLRPYVVVIGAGQRGP